MIRRAVALGALAFTLGMAAPALAHDDHATPVAGDEPDVTLVLIEHAAHVAVIDVGDEGDSIGDVIVWGPDPLFDESNTTDTGATTQGTCTQIASGDCVVVETIAFPDGSTLEIQGLQPGEPMTSTRTIVGGSGEYLGAYGTVTVEPTEDLQYWSKTFEIWVD